MWDNVRMNWTTLAGIIATILSFLGSHSPILRHTSSGLATEDAPVPLAATPPSAAAVSPAASSSVVQVTPMEQPGGPIAGTTTQPQARKSAKGTIDQAGLTLSLRTNPSLTGTISGNFKIAQVFAVPLPYTGRTDHTTIYQLAMGYDLGEGEAAPEIQYGGVAVDSEGHWRLPVSYIVDPQKHENYLLLLYGIPPNDRSDPAAGKDADLSFIPTLLATADISVQQ